MRGSGVKLSYPSIHLFEKGLLRLQCIEAYIGHWTGVATIFTSVLSWLAVY